MVSTLQCWKLANSFCPATARTVWRLSEGLKWCSNLCPEGDRTASSTCGPSGLTGRTRELSCLSCLPHCPGAQCLCELSSVPMSLSDDVLAHLCPPETALMAFGASSCPSLTCSRSVRSANAPPASLPAPLRMMEGSTRYLFREEEVFKGTSCRSFEIFSRDTWAGGNSGFVSAALRLFTNSRGEAASGEGGTWHRQASML